MKRCLQPMSSVAPMIAPRASPSVLGSRSARSSSSARCSTRARDGQRQRRRARRRRRRRVTVGRGGRGSRTSRRAATSARSSRGSRRKVGPQLVSAYVDTVLVRPGATVKRGDVIATLDCRNASAIEQAVAMQARAVEAQQTREPRTRRRACRAARRQVRLAERSRAEGGRRREQAGAARSRCKAQMVGTSLEVNDCVLRAPFDGEIAIAHVDPGALRPAGLVDRDGRRSPRRAHHRRRPRERLRRRSRPGTPVRVHLLATGADLTAKISRRAPAADPGTRTVHIEIDVDDPERTMPVWTTAEISLDVGEPVAGDRDPADRRRPCAAARRPSSSSTAASRTRRVAKLLGERGGTLYVDPTRSRRARKVVTEGRGAARRRRSRSPRDGRAVDARRPEARNDRALAQATRSRSRWRASALVVFAAVVTPRMSVDTFPELTPPVLVVGTLAPGLGPKDVEKTLTWRIEKYVSATPGVDHVESVSRNNLSIVFVWLKWGTDLNAAQTLVQQQVQFAMSAVPKSLGVLPPFVLQYDPSNAPVVQVAVYGGGTDRPAALRLRAQQHRAAARGHPGRRERVAQRRPAAPDQRHRRSGQGAGARRHRRRTSRAAVAQSNALLPSGELITPKFDANVYTNAIAERVADIGDAIIKLVDGKPVRIARRRARRGRRRRRRPQAVSINGEDGVYLNVLRVPGGNTIEIVDAVKDTIANLKDLPPGVHVKPIFDQSTFVRTTYHGLKKEVVQALVLIALVILVFLQSVRGTLVVSLAIPLSFAITLHRALRDRPDPQRVHARRAHARDGAPRRRRGRRARVDPPPPQRGHVAARRRARTARTPSCCRCSRRRSRRWPCSCRCCCSPASRSGCSCRSR